MRLCCFTDVHIHDQYSLTQTLDLLSKIKINYSPELFIGLGDMFDHGQALLDYGPQLKAGLERLGVPSLMVYGNHDGSADSFGGAGNGWQSFQKLFGPAQQAVTVQSNHLITLGDMEATSDWEAFADENIQEGSIVFMHGMLSQQQLDHFAEKGAKYIFHGHLHMSIKMFSANQKCEQISLSSFRFGGMDNTPPGAAMIELKEDRYDLTWALSNLSDLNGEMKDDQAKTKELAFYHHKSEDQFLQQADFTHRGYRYTGSYFNIKCWKKETLVWETKNGGPGFHDLCPLSVYRSQGKSYLLAGGTWVSIEGEFKSLRVLDAATGEALYDIPIVGLSVPPTCHHGVAYAVGQFRELVAFKISTGEILWSVTCETKTENLNWRDNRFGGGWSVTSILVGEHLWVANFRGDLFGVDKKSGEFKFVYEKCLPTDSYGVYAYTLGFSDAEIETEITMSGEMILHFGDNCLNDTTGELYTKDKK